MKLDDQGRVVLDAETLRRLGWSAGQELQLQLDGDRLLLQPATPAATLKEEARRLADAMRGVAGDLAAQVTHAAAGVAAVKPGHPTEPTPPVPPLPPAPPTPPAPAASNAAPTPAAPAAAAHLAPFHGVMPRLGEEVYLAPGATVLGDVVLGDHCSVWPGAVIRGDVAAVRVGARCNIQDGAVLHVSAHQPCVLGEGVTVGHQATVHACHVGDYTLIGIHAVVLDGAQVGRHCLVGAGTVITPGTVIPEGSMVLGTPGRVVRELTAAEIEQLHWSAGAYQRLARDYMHPQPAEVLPPAAPAPPQPPVRGELPRYVCRRAPGPIVVDGALDDAGWQNIPYLSSLVLSDGSGHPQQSTLVQACWDEHALYVAFSCKDSDVWGHFEQRDDPIYDEEVVEFFVCPTGDLHHYYEVEVSPCNVVFDARVFSPEGNRRTMLVDKEWNAVGLQTAVRVSGSLNQRSAPDIGWIAEIALPFKALGLEGPPAPGTVWKANFFRIERGERVEFSAWSPTGEYPPDFHVPACFGELIFSDDNA